MEKYVIPPIFNLDFKFPPSFLLLQQIRQVQESQRLSQPAVARVRSTNGKNSSRLASPPRRAGCRSYRPPTRGQYERPAAQRPATCRERDVSLLTVHQLRWIALNLTSESALKEREI